MANVSKIVEPTLTISSRFGVHSKLGQPKKRSGGRLGFVIDDMPEVRETWLEIPVGKGAAWLVAVRFVPVIGQPTVAEIRVFPNESRRPHLGEWSAAYLDQDDLDVPQGGVPGSVLEGIRINQIRDYFEEIALQWHRGEMAKSRIAERAGFPDDLTPARPYDREPDAFYAQVAHVYASQPGPGRHLATADILTEKLGYEVTTQEVRNWVNTARRRELLSSLGQGKSGGALTKKGLGALDTLLERDREDD